MNLWRRGPQLDGGVRERLQLGRGEDVLAFGVDDNTGATVVATAWRLVVATAERVVSEHDWFEVDTGHWEPETTTLTVSWVDRSRPVQWSFRDQATRLPEALHERVQASVVLASPLALTGPRRSGRVAIRKDLRDQRLFEQVVLGRQTPADDPQVQAEVARVTADLRDKVGL